MKTLSTNLNVRTLVFSALFGVMSTTLTPSAIAAPLVLSMWCVAPNTGNTTVPIPCTSAEVDTSGPGADTDKGSKLTPPSN